MLKIGLYITVLIVVVVHLGSLVARQDFYWFEHHTPRWLCGINPMCSVAEQDFEKKMAAD